MTETLDIHLRRHYIAQTQARRPRLPAPLKQLGAVGRVVPPIPAGSRPVIVKTTVTNSSTTGYHLAYLQRQGKGPNRQVAPLFGPQSLAAYVFAKTASQQDPHQFRIMVSMAEHRQLDRTQYITLLMAQVERDLGRPLQWVASNHYDTAHPHTHIVLRADPLNGKDFYMDKSYLLHGMRARAAQLLTWFLGPVRHQEAQRTQVQQQTSLYRQSDRLIRDGVVRDGDDPDLRQLRSQSLGGAPVVPSPPIPRHEMSQAARVEAFRRIEQAQDQARRQRRGWNR